MECIRRLMLVCGACLHEFDGSVCCHAQLVEKLKFFDKNDDARGIK